MTRTLKLLLRPVVASVILGMSFAVSSAAQGPGGPPPGGGGGGQRFPGGGPGQQQPQPGPRRDNPGGLELGPPGRWWDDGQFAAALKLRPDQRTRMDAIFEQSREALLVRLEAVRQAEAQMHELATSAAPDEGAIFTQIDRISQSRADLEKTTTHMLLLIRREMDPGQIKLLKQQMQR
jgi:Spy/CpxP family protein refolding chaperone